MNLVFPRSLRYQLLSRILFILAGLLLIIGLFQYVFMERFLYQNRATSIQRQIQSIPGELWERFRPHMRRGPGDAFIFFPASRVAFMNKEGEISVLSSTSGSEETITRLEDQVYKDAIDQPRRAKPLFNVVNVKGEGEQLIVLQAVRSWDGTNGIVQVSTSTGPLKAELYRQFTLYLVLAFAALIGGLFLFLPAIRRTLIPLSRMVSTVERIDSGKLNERLSESNQPMEVNRLSHSFNRMLERLETSFLAEQEAKEQMRRFVSDASHELRTPLTSIHGFLEILLRGAAADPQQLNKALKSMHSESVRINTLVNDLLQLSKLDRKPALERVSYELGQLIEEMEPQLQVLAGERSLVLDSPAGVVLAMDLNKMKQVVLNLFQNAVQHTDPESGFIQLSVLQRDGFIELSVKDNGTGIAPEHLPYLFHRFYRIDHSRTRKHGGAGLGLAITRSLVELHNGSIDVESCPGEGSLFRVSLPSNG